MTLNKKYTWFEKKLFQGLHEFGWSFLLVFLLLFADPSVFSASLDAALNYGKGGTFNLDPQTTYYGGVYVTAPTEVHGHGAQCIMVDPQSIAVVQGGILKLENMKISGGMMVAMDENTRLEIQNVEFNNCTTGIWITNRAHAKAVKCIFNSTDFSISAYDGIVDLIDECVFNKTQQVAVRLDKKSAATIKNTLFTGEGKNGVFLSENSNLRINECTFDFWDFCISANNSEIESISSCVFKQFSNTGISLNNSEIKSLSGCVFEGQSSGNGIYMSESSRLKLYPPASQFSSCDYGISVQNGNAFFEPDSFSMDGCKNSLFMYNILNDVDLTGVNINNTKENAVFFLSSTPRTLTISRSIIWGAKDAVYVHDGCSLVIKTDHSGTQTTIGGAVNGILLGAGCNAQIADLTISGCKGNGIFANNSDNVLVENSQFENNTNPSAIIANKPFCLSGNSVNNLIIRGCRFANCDKTIYVTNGTNIMVENCSMKKCRYFEGVGIHDNSKGTVRYCDFEDCLSGVSVRQSSQAWIYNNTVVNSRVVEEHIVPFGQGFFIERFSTADIVNNIIINNDNEGIYLESSSGSVVHNYIDNNGHEALDGNGVYCHNSSFIIMDNFIARNFLYGIEVSEKPCKIFQNDIRYNNRGAIRISSMADVDARYNICYDNDKQTNPTDTVLVELMIEKTGTKGKFLNNTIEGSSQGVLISEIADAKLIANLICNNSDFNINIGTGANAYLFGNVLNNSKLGVYIKYATIESAKYNEMTNCSDFGVIYDSSWTDFDFTKNWWGDISGPWMDIHPDGKGSPAFHVNVRPWLAEPFARYATMNHISFEKDEPKQVSSPKMNFVKLSAKAGQKLEDEYLSFYMTKGVNIFPDYPYTGNDMIGNGIFLSVNSSYGLRNNLKNCALRIYKDSFIP